MKRYTEFITELNRENQLEQDRILDKIHKYSIDSITDREKEYLDAISKGESPPTISDGFFHNDEFEFELDSIKEFDQENKIIGTLTYNNIKFYGEINVDDDGILLWYSLIPEFPKGEVEFIGNPNNKEAIKILIGDIEVLELEPNELEMDNYGLGNSFQLYDLYKTDKRELSDRLYAILNNKSYSDTTFDDLLEDNDDELSFHEFIDYLSSNLIN